MDDDVIQQHLSKVNCVEVKTTRLEIYTIVDGSVRVLKDEGDLQSHEMPAFLHATAPFEVSRLNYKARVLGGIRLILQLRAKGATFENNVCSVEASFYKEMISTLRMPYQIIESSGIPAQFYWSHMGRSADGPILQIIIRKKTLNEKGVIHWGWELFLSFDPKTGVSFGFSKGSNAKRLQRSINALKDCEASHILHPMLLPVLIISFEIGTRIEKSQNEARRQLGHVEKDVEKALRGYSNTESQSALPAIDELRKSISECHRSILWKQPLRYLQVVTDLRSTLTDFFNHLPNERKEDLGQAQSDLDGRLTFLQAKLQTLDHMASMSMARLQVQREILQDLVELNLTERRRQQNDARVAEQERQKKADDRTAALEKLTAEAYDEQSRRTAELQSLLSVLGILFLPGSLIASIFSTTFFDFRAGTGERVITPNFWIYWAVTIPITSFLFVAFLWFRHHISRERPAHSLRP